MSSTSLDAIGRFMNYMSGMRVDQLKAFTIGFFYGCVKIILDFYINSYLNYQLSLVQWFHKCLVYYSETVAGD